MLEDINDNRDLDETTLQLVTKLLISDLFDDEQFQFTCSDISRKKSIISRGTT